jgi:uncharacterized repeat protein (TIGR01451 family)
MRKAFIGALALVAVMAQPVFAETPSPLELAGYVKLEKVTTDDAGERIVELVEPEVVVPGDRLIFGTHYTNAGSRKIENFVVSNPVPAAVRVAEDVDPALSVSVDGGKNWGRLGDLSITADDGSTRPATARDISHIRWTLAEVAPGESGQLEFPVAVR